MTSLTTETPVKYKRIIVKLSGEILAGSEGVSIDPASLNHLSEEIRSIHNLGVEVGVVIGGGNIIRGTQAAKIGMDRASADYMGMLATTINALALQDSLEQKSIYTRVLTAIEMREIAEPYIRRRAIRHLEKGRVVIFACGTGNPYFTTDTAASLRAMEIGAEVVLKGTKVSAVYDSDPNINKEAKPYSEISFIDVLKQGLKVMDAAAISLCMDNNLPIIVFNILEKGNLKKILTGEKVGTFVQK